MKLSIILKRILISVVTVFMAVLLIFFILRSMPGSAVDNMARGMAQSLNIPLDAAYTRVVSMINYDPLEPILQQLSRYISGLLQGNLGTSMIYQSVSVNQIVARALPWTVFVLSISLVISFFVGTNLGVIMAWKRKTILDPIISAYAIVTTAIPNFIVGILLLVIFAFSLEWFPINGAYNPNIDPGFTFEFILSCFYHAALPIMTYVITTLGMWALTMKGSAVNILGEDYINAAYIRGVSDKNIMKNYVKKNAMLPMITSLAVNFGFMLGGSPLIENTFGYPGMGYYIGQATGQRDFTLMQGLLLVTSLAVILANLIADLVYCKLDPRVNIEE